MLRILMGSFSNGSREGHEFKTHWVSTFYLFKKKKKYLEFREAQ